jgi:hypothetical protein
MLDPSSDFLYKFFILFLGILLLTFAMFEAMVHYDPDVRPDKGPSTASDQEREHPEVNRRALPDLTALYRANLFAIDLCLIVLAEALLIVLFVRFTIPAALTGTAILLFMMVNVGRKLRSKLVVGGLSRFVTNRYATLSHTDMVLLIVLSGLIMAFLVSAMLKQGGASPGISPVHKDTPPPSSS